MTILQYCSVCKTEYDMEIVPTADDDGVLWLQCPTCRGFLPKVKSASNVPMIESTPDETQTAKFDGSDVDIDDIDAIAAVLIDDDDEIPATTDTVPTEIDDGSEQIADMDVSLAVAYRPWQKYAEGDVIHHLAWDDFGVVLAKEILPGHRHVVKVRFSEAGIVRLIEGHGERPG